MFIDLVILIKRKYIKYVKGCVPRISWRFKEMNNSDNKMIFVENTPIIFMTNNKNIKIESVKCEKEVEI